MYFVKYVPPLWNQVFTPSVHSPLGELTWYHSYFHPSSPLIDLIFWPKLSCLIYVCLLQLLTQGKFLNWLRDSCSSRCYHLTSPWCPRAPWRAGWASASTGSGRRWGCRWCWRRGARTRSGRSSSGSGPRKRSWKKNLRERVSERLCCIYVS